VVFVLECGHRHTQSQTPLITVPTVTLDVQNVAGTRFQSHRVF